MISPLKRYYEPHGFACVYNIIHKRKDTEIGKEKRPVFYISDTQNHDFLCLGITLCFGVHPKLAVPRKAASKARTSVALIPRPASSNRPCTQNSQFPYIAAEHGALCKLRILLIFLTSTFRRCLINKSSSAQVPWIQDTYEACPSEALYSA